jgi:hypothetical protein
VVEVLAVVELLEALVAEQEALAQVVEQAPLHLPGVALRRESPLFRRQSA